MVIILCFFSMEAFGQVNSEPDVERHRQVVMESQQIPRFESDTSSSFPIAVPDNYESTTGYLVVFEDRNDPGSSVIRLPVAIVHARSKQSNTAPVLYLTGGPGSSALNAAAYPGAYPFTENHDFIVLEQRGTRFAEPALNCPEFVDARQQSMLLPDRESKITLQVEAAASCRNRLEEEGINPNAYHSAASAADVEDLRRVLAINQWILYGISYGSRLALTIMRDYPESIYASILVSVLPPQVNYDDESVINYKASLERVFRDCLRIPTCKSAFPNLKERFYAVLDEVDKRPLEITIQNDTDKKNLSLDGGRLASLIDLSSSYGIARAPNSIDRIARRDTSFLIEAVSNTMQPSNFAWGMRFSVWCSDELPYTERATGIRLDAGLHGMESAVFYPEVCEAWGARPSGRIEAEPVFSDAPTLLISGEYDPDTPPMWAEVAAHTLTNSLHIVFRGAGHVPTHNWSGDGCAMKLAGSFAENPMQFKDPAMSLPACVLEQKAPEFYSENKEGR